MKSKLPGIITIAVALILIASGIIVKRFLGMPQYLMVFHILGGLSLVTGIVLLVLSRPSKE